MPGNKIYLRSTCLGKCSHQALSHEWTSSDPQPLSGFLFLWVRSNSCAQHIKGSFQCHLKISFSCISKMRFKRMWELRSWEKVAKNGHILAKNGVNTFFLLISHWLKHQAISPEHSDNWTSRSLWMITPEFKILICSDKSLRRICLKTKCRVSLRKQSAKPSRRVSPHLKLLTKPI